MPTLELTRYESPIDTVTARTAEIDKDALIDGMCIAVQCAHSLRILHRAINIDAFVVVDNQVKLTNWDHAVFNFGNSSYRNTKQNTFRDPSNWHAQTPELTRHETSEYIQYGFEYDMWCLGTVIFDIMYRASFDEEVDVGDFTNEWLATWMSSHTLIDIPNAAVYRIVIKTLLTTDQQKRASSYAIKNMCDGPRHGLFESQSEVMKEQSSINKYQLDDKFHGWGRNFDSKDYRIDTLLGNFIDDPIVTYTQLQSTVILPVNKSRDYRTYTMRQLMIATDAGIAGNMQPNYVLWMYDILAQAIYQCDRPIEFGDLKYLKKLNLSSSDLLYNIANIANGLVGICINM